MVSALALGSMNIFTVLTAIYCFTAYDKCTYCKSLWVKASAKCPTCRTNTVDWTVCVSLGGQRFYGQSIVPSSKISPDQVEG